MPVNRKLHIAVTFNCTHNGKGNNYGGSAVYTQTCSTPNMGNIVDADGTIRLDCASQFDDTAYNHNVDIEFTLATPCTVMPDNTTIPVAWATQYGPGMTIQVPAKGSSGEMTVIFDKNKPNVITIDDKDNDSNTYNYKPALELIRPPLNNYYISLDPRIVNRPH